MGYQESYITASKKEDFSRIVKRIKELGLDYYERYGAIPVEIITFEEEHDPFSKGQQAVYFVGERYLQNGLEGRILGYPDEIYEEMDEYEINKCIEECMSYNLIKYFTEDVDPSGIWKDAGAPLTTIHEPFIFNA